MELFKDFKNIKISKKFNKSSDEVNKHLKEHPLLDSKNVWNSKVAQFHSTLRLWQLITFISLFITVGSVGGIIYFGSAQKFIPYVVEVNKLGETVVVKPLDVGTVKDPRIIRARVADFINSLRTVTFDNALQRDTIFRVYSSLKNGDPAIARVNKFYKAPETNPFERSKDITVEIQIISLVANSESTYQVDWNENVYNKAGRLVEVKSYRALVNIFLLETAIDNIEDLIKNPLGIYVKDFNITELRVQTEKGL